MKQIIATILVIVALIGIGIGTWQVKRYFNYKFGYQSSVQSEIQKQIKPLEARVKALEIQLQTLKTNK